MKTRAKRCTVKGNSIDPLKAPAHAPTDEKLSDGQNADHYVLCPEDRAKGYVEPFRIDYIHEKCGGRTTMPRACAETYAVQPSYYGSTFCCTCHGYFPVGADGEFIWNDGSRQKVGTRRPASGTEAQRATTAQQGVVHDGPTGKARGRPMTMSIPNLFYKSGRRG